MDLIYTYDKKFRSWFREYLPLIGGSIVGGIMAYFMLLACDLVNNLDGMWHTSNFVAGNWEISLGRGLLRYWDKLRFGVVSVPLNSILTIAIIALAVPIVLDLFGIKNKIIAALVSAVMIVNPTVCCTLTYSYHSVNYALAFFLGVMAAACVYYIGSKTPVLGILIGGGVLAITMATYQPYMGVTCILLLMLLIDMLLKCHDSKRIIKHVITSLCSIPVGGLFYWLFTQFMLYRTGMELASYGGAGSVSVGKIIMNLPSSFVNCYRLYYDFFISYKMNLPLSLTTLLVLTIAALFVICVACQFIRLLKHHVGYAITFMAAVLLIPVGCDFVTIVAVGSGLSQLMTMSLVLSVALISVLLPQKKLAGFVMKRAYCLVMFLLVWFSLVAVTNDQLALKEGKTATLSLAENMIHTLTEEGYFEEGSVFAFVGRPAENDMFAQSETFRNANIYAQFGCFSTSAGNSIRTWSGIFHNYCGTNINLCGEAQYDALRQNEIVEQMPEFPKEGSIREIDGVIVVKVSELY